MEESNPELESFRQQWRAEVSARSQGDGNKSSKSSNAGPPKISRRTSHIIGLAPEREDEEYTGPRHAFKLSGSIRVEGEEAQSSKPSDKEPQTALEHYEKAVERESQGSLGDSLGLYRKAFRVSHRTMLRGMSNKFSDGPPGRSKVQEQTLSAILFFFETSEPKSVKCSCHCTKYCPSLPRRAPTIYKGTHCEICWSCHTARPT